PPHPPCLPLYSKSHGRHANLHSFPTRRSSDLKRNDDLLNEIIQRRKANQLTAQTDPLARILDDLNVMDTLETIRRRSTLCYGPKDRKSTRLNSSHVKISYAVFCLKKKNYKQHK